MQLLKDKVAIITGGASGIGLATVELFVEHGARVVVADIDGERGQTVAERLDDAVLFIPTDVSCADQIHVRIDACVDHFGGLDIMFNNAGISGDIHYRLLDDGLKDFGRVLAVNLFGVMAGTQCAADYMAHNGGGVVINTSSLAALLPGLPLLTYRAAKAGVIQFTQSAARDLAEYGIRVNAISPGHIPASMTFYDMSERIRRFQPLQRQGVPRDAANAALFLASELSAHITGTNLPVDGGSHLGGPLQATE